MDGSLEFETLISELSLRLVDLPPDEVDEAIEGALRRVSEVLGIDSSALWQASGVSPQAFSVTHFYHQGGRLQHAELVVQENLPYVREQILAGRVVRFSALDELPAEAAVDRDQLRRGGIKSGLCLPLLVGGGSPVGALALTTLRGHLEWPEALINRLQLVAQVFGSALARKRADEGLRESEERLSLAADAAEAGLWILDYTSQVFWVTARTRAIFEFTADEIVTLERLQAAVHPGDWGLVREAIERSTRSIEPTGVEYRILTGEGGVRWVLSRGRSHLTPTGEPDRVMGVSIDITERKRAEEALLASESRLKAAAELAGLAFYEIDYAAGTMFVDDRLRDLCGIPPNLEGPQIQDFWFQHLHPDDAPRMVELTQSGMAGEMDQYLVDYRYLPPDQAPKWIRHIARAATRDGDGGLISTYGVLRDVTERYRVEADLRDLSRRLITAHEEERARLARELHDDVSQRLAVLAIEAGRAELAAPQGQQAEAMQVIREGLVRLSDDIHSLAYQLHPSTLEELGLDEALRAESERCGRQGLHVWVHLDPLPDTVAQDVALCLFRVAQEALSNVVQHAAANFATVRLRQMDGGLSLAVSDDGAGFDRESPENRMRLGLLSMRERVRLVNGTIDVESAPGQGTTIVAWVPLVGEAR